MPTLTFSPIAIKGMTTHYVDVMVLYYFILYTKTEPTTHIIYLHAIYKYKRSKATLNSMCA